MQNLTFLVFARPRLLCAFADGVIKKSQAGTRPGFLGEIAPIESTARSISPSVLER